MNHASQSRWQLIRESIKFQIKLMLDAVRDLLLSPVAIVCTILDLISGNSKQQGHFQRLMLLGHKSDHWLNLFGDVPETTQSTTTNGVSADSDGAKLASSPPPSPSSSHEDNARDKIGRVDTSLDNLFEKIESFVSEQPQSGVLTHDNKQKIDHYLTVLLARRKDATMSKSQSKSTLQPDNNVDKKRE